jgi:hypothetical protein
MRCRRASVFAVLFAAATLLLGAAGGWAATQTFTDAEGDGSGGPECDIAAASVGSSHGRLVFSITTAQPIASKLAAPWFQIYRKPGEINRGMAPPAELSGNGYPPTPLSLTNERKTVTYKIKPGTLRARLGVAKKQKRFFWVARECFMHPDYAPDAGPEKPRVVGHPF